MKVGIYGPGGFGRELIPVVGLSDDLRFISDFDAEVGAEVLGVPVVSLSQFAQNSTDAVIVIAVADAAVRREMAEKIVAAGLTSGSAIAPTAIIGPDVELGEGVVLCHHTVITASARIGRQFHANIFSYVAHDCVIGDFVTLAPRVCINGNVIVEDDAYIGTGAILKQGTKDRPLRIGQGAIVGMGAVVTKDVAPHTVVVGNPAKPLPRG
jgi:sugar O-acyltransferase (sialic acid O-acetyltransferase NeuD family)